MKIRNFHGVLGFWGFGVLVGLRPSCATEEVFL